jgi:hypothetical protein
MHREYGDPAPTYDLIRLREPVALAAGVAVPSWVEPALRRTPWVMVRRGYVREGMLPVGARGAARHQRFAAFVAVGEIAERRSPEDLTTLPYAIAPRRQDAVPALAEIITPQGRRYVETFDVAPDDRFYPISSDTTAAVRLTGDALQATFKGPTDQSDAVRCILSADQQVMTCSGVLNEGNGRTANYVAVYDRI